jgi:hypothetical protein
MFKFLSEALLQCKACTCLINSNLTLSASTDLCSLAASNRSCSSSIDFFSHNHLSSSIVDNSKSGFVLTILASQGNIISVILFY